MPEPTREVERTRIAAVPALDARHQLGEALPRRAG
jgi:hypothetical protein